MKFRVVSLEVRVEENQCDCLENALRSILHLSRGKKGEDRALEQKEGSFILRDLSPIEFKQVQEVMQSLTQGGENTFFVTSFAKRNTALSYWGGYRHWVVDRCEQVS